MADKQEFYNLINEKTKVPSLTPVPRIDFTKSEYTDENPLQKFRAQAMKFANKTRPETTTRPKLAAEKWRASLNRISATICQEELVRLSRTTTREQDLMPDWEESIFKLLRKTSKRKHIAFLMTIMKEVRQDYSKVMQNLRLSKDNDEVENLNDAQEQIDVGRVATCLEDHDGSFYAVNRKLVSKRYFLSHRLIRSIATVLHDNLPEFFVDLKNYTSQDNVHVSVLIEAWTNDLHRCSTTIQNYCYNEIVRQMLRMRLPRDDKRLPKLLHCAEGFMVRQITTAMMNSIKKIVEDLKIGQFCPKLAIQLACKNENVELEPSLEVIFRAYHDLIEGIKNTANELVPLSEWYGTIMNDAKTKFIRVEVPEWFLKKSHNDLQKVLDDNFKQVREHCDLVCENFGLLCAKKTKRQIDKLIASKKKFEVYLAKVTRYDDYSRQIGDMVPNVYYSWGVLQQSKAISDLKRCASEIVNILVKELIERHRELNRTICGEFENLESRALAIPDDTKSLFKLTDYVAHASKVLIKELEVKIQISVTILSSLLQITTLSDEHIELNKTTINWLELIKPVFSQHNIFCEAKKGELEDELQKKVNTLNNEIDNIFPDLCILNDMDDAKRVLEYKEFLIVILNRIKQVDRKIELINEEEKLFKFPETTFPKIDELKELMSSFCSLIHIITQWQRNHQIWINGPFENLNARTIQEKTENYYNQITEIHKNYKIKIKSDLTTNKPFKFFGTVDDPDPMQQPAPLKLCWKSLQDLGEFKKYVPLAVCFCNPALEKRHWDEMSNIAGVTLFPNAGTTLKKIIDLNLLKDYDKYEIVSVSADKELALQQKFNLMTKIWDDVDFSTVTEVTLELPIFKEEEKIDVLLEEQFIEIQKMRASFFVTPIENKIVEFHEKLHCVRDTIELWNMVQEKYKYLKPFFDDQIVQSHLGSLVESYDSIGTTLGSLAEALASAPIFNFVGKASNLLENLKQVLRACELIKAKVSEYLKKLKLSFTRLFFISDHEVLQLLFKREEGKCFILQKCFPNVINLKTDDKKSTIVCSIIGEGGEELKLNNPISTENLNSATDWLVSLDKEISRSINHEINEFVNLFDDEVSVTTITSKLAMVTFCVWQIMWTTQVQSCFSSSSSNTAEALKTCRNRFTEHKENTQQLLKLNLTIKDREIVTSLIVLLIHLEEVINLLVEKKIHDDADFDWIAQIRYYYQIESGVDVCLINACVKYACEYYSGAQKISVNTPMTERCYRSLIEANCQNYYGEIVGFPGTGKTETIKNLARIFAMPFFLFSPCIDDKQNYKQVIDVLHGLVSFRVWVHFKNFAKIKEEMASVVAQYVYRITQARNTDTTLTINIDGTQLPFNKNSYLSLSLDLGSQTLHDLPNNLRLHFRRVCFTLPDVEKICQIKLYAAGFEDSKNLSRTLKKAYDLCNDLTTCSRATCDLKSIKCLVDNAAKLKFIYSKDDERALLMRSLIDVNIPRYVENDVVAFRSILQVLFFGVDLPPPNNAELMNAVDKICIERKLSNHEALKLKVIQLHEMIHFRKAIVIVGDAFSGKTTILNVLKEALASMRNQDNNNYLNIDCEVINFSALSENRLFGYFDEKTGERYDGILKKVVHRFKNCKDTRSSSFGGNWLIFDGDLKGSGKVEKLDTLIDSDESLFRNNTIADNEMRIFFETSTLQDVLPSTITRCGILHLDSESIDWRSFLLANLSSKQEFRDHQTFIYSLFDWLVEPCLEFLRDHCVVSLKLTSTHLVMSTLDLFDMYMNSALEENDDKKDKDYMIVWSQAALIMAVNWALTGTLDFESRLKFETFFMKLWNDDFNDSRRPVAIRGSEISLPIDGKLQDYVYVFKGTGCWKNFSELLKTEKICDDILFREIFVPTVESVKLSRILNLHVKNCKPFVLCGESSCGKTTFFENYRSNNLIKSKNVSFTHNFEYMTKSEVAQTLILSKLNKVKRHTYEPSKNRSCLHFIDDFNVTSYENDVDDASSTLELIRQYFDHGFWYDLHGTSKITMTNVFFGISLTTPRKKTHNVCSRFLRHFNVFTMNPQTKDSMFRIFSNVLLYDLKKNSFTPDVTNSVNSITNATLEVYIAAFQDLKPVPVKPLYRFSTRDVQRIIRGCGLIRKESVENKTTFVRLWAHETFRVLGDRMQHVDDKKWLFSKIRQAVKIYFKDPFETIFDHLPKYKNDELTCDSFDSLVFGNFIDDSRNKYEEIISHENLKNKFLKRLKDYNDDSNKKLDVVVTRHAIRHMVRICRLLANPGECMLMISTSGSGRKSLVRLSSRVQGQNLFEPTFDFDYDEISWKNDIKSLMFNCGTSTKEHVFSLTDRNLKPEFMRDVVGLISGGDIPFLFDDDEKRDIVKKVRLEAQGGNRNLEMSASRVYDFFLHRCKRNLHLIINASLVDANFSNYLLKYPGLIDKCTINWLDDWPESALEEVANHYIKDTSIAGDTLKERVTIASKHCYETMVRASLDYREKTGKIIYVTNARFVKTIRLYVKIFNAKQQEIKTARKRYLIGLDKLQLAEREVAQMKNTLTELRPQLEASARQTELTMKEIESENTSVERARILVKRDEEMANKKAEVADALRSECEAELAVAIPILEDALAALNTLKPTDITLVKAMKNPPDTVKLVMAAVCVMLNVSSEKIVDPVTGRKTMDYWGPSKRVLGDMNFLQNLKDYDKDNISPIIMQTIKKNYMSDKNFMPHIVAKASSAAEGLCKWVRAMVSYDEVAKVVAPKKEKLATAQRECDETLAFLTDKRKTLADLSKKLAASRSALEATLLKKLELEKEVRDCTVKLKKAEGLISSLAGEKTRWLDSAKKLGRSFDNLPGDALLATTMITYLSSYDLNHREKLILDWKDFMKNCDLPCSMEHDFIDFLGNELEINAWQLNGLSNNRFSLQNAIIARNSPFWCLFVDPQAQANEWIKKIEKPNDLQTIKVTDANYVDVIRKNAQLGRPVLLESLDRTIDPALDSILDHETYGNENKLKSNNFRLYLTTKHHDSRYNVNVFNRLTIIDHLLPSDAIRDRLLDIVISKERPELQEKFEKVLAENVNVKRIIEQQEDNILHVLTVTSKNILEDDGAIKILDSSKTLALDSIKRREATRISKEEIESFRDTYTQFTNYCADMYSTLNLLPNLNHMYRFSLKWFTQLYVKSIETSNRSVVHKKRIDYLKMSSVQNLHQSVQSALFDRDKLIFSFLLCAKTLMNTEQINEQEFNFFMSLSDEKYSLGNSKEKEDEDNVSNPASPWLSDKSWKDLCKTSSTLMVFQNFTNSFSANLIKWKKFSNPSDGEDNVCSTMPSPWDNKLTAFQKLILIRILCPDRIITKTIEFVESIMGQQSNFNAPNNITRPYAESNCFTPLILILPTYSSSFAVVNKFAKVLGYSAKLHVLSMGTGQEEKAELLIEMARKNGEWIFLHNCHLVLSWIGSRLERICENFNDTNTDLGFRLWMSTESNVDFPIGIVQNSIKIALDFPYDVKQTLTWSYKTEPIRDKEFFEGCPGKDKTFSKLLYSFCLFHALLRERQNFGQQGWNYRYNFDESDLQLSIVQLKNWINQYDKVPFKALTYFLSECNYGGKIIDLRDKIYLDSQVLDFCNFKVINDTNYDFDTVFAYRVPKRIEYRDYLKHIKNTIPVYTSPEDLGLDKNVSLLKINKKVDKFFESLSCLNTTIVIPNIEDNNKLLESTIVNILEKLPENFNVSMIKTKYPIEETYCLNNVLIEEVKTYNIFLNTIRDSLNELKTALIGDTCLTKKLLQMSDEILKDFVPKSWKIHVTLLTKKLLSKFIIDLLERVKFIDDWILNGHQNFYWFGGLTSCKRLLSTIKIIFAKKNQVSLDQVGFEFNVKDTNDNIESLEKNVINVQGLYLIGARWNEQTKSLCNPRTKIFYHDVPVVTFEPVLKKNLNSVNNYKCPLYVSPSLHESEYNSNVLLQDNYILTVTLKTDVNPKVWIKRGTALYCQIE